jgi:hypothetical protein
VTISIGGIDYAAPEPPVYVTPDQERAVELFTRCWECVKTITLLDRRLDKRIAWRDANRHLEGTELFMDREGMIHGGFADKAGAWRSLVKASSMLQKELERWPPKDRAFFCEVWGFDWPCEVFTYQIETSLAGTPFARTPPY